MPCSRVKALPVPVPGQAQGAGNPSKRCLERNNSKEGKWTMQRTDSGIWQSVRKEASMSEGRHPGIVVERRQVHVSTC